MNNSKNLFLATLAQGAVFYFATEATKAVRGAAIAAAFAGNNAAGLIPRSVANKFGAIANSYDPDIPDHTGVLGLPVYGSLLFGNTDPHDTSGNKYTGIDGQIYTFDNLQVDACLVTCDQATNVISEKITGRPGRVNEFIGLDQWVISIELTFDSEVNQAPTSFISNVWQIKQAQCPIPITNYFLNLLDINYIIIKNISYPQKIGKYSSQTVIISAVSDIPLANFLP